MIVRYNLLWRECLANPYQSSYQEARIRTMTMRVDTVYAPFDLGNLKGHTKLTHVF